MTVFLTLNQELCLFPDGECITVESKCYMPDLESHEDAKISKETISYVNEYTWNIFCIFTDLIDDLLRRENITAAIEKTVPMGLGKNCLCSWARVLLIQ